MTLKRQAIEILVSGALVLAVVVFSLRVLVDGWHGEINEGDGK